MSITCAKYTNSLNKFSRKIIQYNILKPAQIKKDKSKRETRPFWSEDRYFFDSPGVQYKAIYAKFEYSI